MKSTLNMSLAIAGTALILLTGCVSNRKYKASQAALAKVRSDSAQLAQQVSSLNGNVQSLQDKSSTLQRSVDSSSSRIAEQQKSLDYYQGYFKEQQDTLAQVNQDVQSALTQAGVTNGDVSQQEDVIYVRLDENDVFKKGTTMVSATGRKVLDGIAQVAMNHSNVNVAVASGDSAIGWAEMNNSKMSADNDNSGMSAEPKHHAVHHHHPASPASGGSGSGNGAGNSTASNAQASGSANSGASGSGGQSSAAPEHKKVHHHYSSEGSMAFKTAPGHHPGWALKQGRMVAVANHFIQNGMPKVNVTVQRPPMNGAQPGNAIKIVIRPTMHHANPQNASAMAGTERQ